MSEKKREYYIQSLEEILESDVVTYFTKSTIKDLLELLKEEPKRNTGEWITDACGNVICSECGWCAPKIMKGCLANRHLDYEKSEFCWHCGAYMRGEQE